MQVESGDVIWIPRANFPANAQIVPASPIGNWITEAELWNIWREYEQGKGNLDPMEIDAILYTNNSIFTLTSNNSNYRGKIVVNGSLVSRDMGVLAPGGLTINYDERVRQHLGIRDDNSLNLTRGGVWIDRTASPVYKP